MPFNVERKLSAVQLRPVQESDIYLSQVRSGQYLLFCDLSKKAASNLPAEIRQKVSTTPRGRQKHAARQARYRRKKKVTQQGSQQSVAHDSLKEAEVTELARVFSEPQLPAKKEARCDFAARALDFLRAESSGRVVDILGD